MNNNEATLAKTTYTLGSRTYRAGSLLNPITKTRATILEDGRYYADVPDGEDAQALIANLNASAQAATEYRAQFATEEDWMRHIDEGSAG